ncbi:arginase deacetylase [Pisolithus croceorrhizus]|nr:arginase deacetylase [Pisolithus croceorrhizus]
MHTGIGRHEQGGAVDVSSRELVPEGGLDITPRASLPESPRSGKRTALYLQDDCLQHRFIRSKDTSGIVERPERLRAVKVGLSAAIAHAGELSAKYIALGKNDAEGGTTGKIPSTEADTLAVALGRMKIGQAQDQQLWPASVTFCRTAAKVDLLGHPAVKYVHGDVDGEVYLENLTAWARDSQDNIAKKGLEIPDGIPPLDLYLCPTSIDAIQGAIGAVCEAVDNVLTSDTHSPSEGGGRGCERAFVAVRPPGHHCGEDTPGGFCFVNNVVIGAAHAHLKHSIKRVVVLDIDLHHGNGTQSLVWQINEETYLKSLESEGSRINSPPTQDGLQIYYGSLHDILSYPCEDGKPHMVQAASTSIHGAHGQHVENIHLQQYDSSEHFWSVLYPKYLNLIHRARDFLDRTGGPGDDVLVFISCGFDACEHEYPSMSRHGRRVPASFYHRFTRDTCSLADQYARGRLVSVLEGGYSDKALISGAMAHVCGLVELEGEERDWVDEEWWNTENISKLEKVIKTRKGFRPSLPSPPEDWLSRTVEILAILDPKPTPSSASSRGSRVPSTARTLRERKKDPRDGGSTAASGRVDTPSVIEGSSGGCSPAPESGTEQDSSTQPAASVTSASGRKKLPRVILHVRPPAT